MTWKAYRCAILIACHATIAVMARLASRRRIIIHLMKMITKRMKLNQTNNGGGKMKCTWPSIDHGILSPSGKMSKRVRENYLERFRVELFGEKGMPSPGLPEQPSKRDRLLREATELRALAARGMKPRAYIKKAMELEAEAQND